MNKKLEVWNLYTTWEEDVEFPIYIPGTQWFRDGKTVFHTHAVGSMAQDVLADWLQTQSWEEISMRLGLPEPRVLPMTPTQLNLFPEAA